MHAVYIVSGFFFLGGLNKSVVRSGVFLFCSWMFKSWVRLVPVWIYCSDKIRLSLNLLLWLWSWRLRSISFRDKFRLLRDCSSTCPVFPTSNLWGFFLLFKFFFLTRFVHSINVLISPVWKSLNTISIWILCHKFWSECTFLNSIIFLEFFLLFDFVLFIFLPKFVSFKKVHLSKCWLVWVVTLRRWFCVHHWVKWVLFLL